MAANTSSVNERIVKVPFPIALIRRMDEAIMSGRGGFQTRTELMREAVENLLNELEFPEATPANPGDGTAVLLGDAVAAVDARTAPADIDAIVGELPRWERRALALADLAATAIDEPPVRPPTFSGGVAEVADEPLLGLHNRDYVSLWALGRLAQYTEGGPIPWETFLNRVTQAAWYFGHQLQRLEDQGGGKKLTVLFPTNATKRQAAERGFQNFAVGSLVRRGEDRSLHASGPLFAWRAIQVQANDERATALTEEGWGLLKAVSGASLALPHSKPLRQKFFAHLRKNATADFWGFEHLISFVERGPNRNELVESFAASHPGWTASMASSVAQGYVARAREWGLVEPRLVEGRYWLTDAGRKAAKQLDRPDSSNQEAKA